jgi:hypothetical protein
MILPMLEERRHLFAWYHLLRFACRWPLFQACGVHVQRSRALHTHSSVLQYFERPLYWHVMEGLECPAGRHKYLQDNSTMLCCDTVTHWVCKVGCKQGGTPHVMERRQPEAVAVSDVCINLVVCLRAQPNFVISVMCGVCLCVVQGMFSPTLYASGKEGGLLLGRGPCVLLPRHGVWHACSLRIRWRQP